MSRDYLNTLAALAVLTRRIWYQMEQLRKERQREDAYNTAEAIRHTMLRIGKELEDLEQRFSELPDKWADPPF